MEVIVRWLDSEQAGKGRYAVKRDEYAPHVEEHSVDSIATGPH